MAALGSDIIMTGGFITPPLTYFTDTWTWDSQAPADAEYIITDIKGNTIGLRKVIEGRGGVQYGRSDLSVFKVAKVASIDQKRQVVAVEWDHQKLRRP
jgi:hypothetical protein